MENQHEVSTKIIDVELALKSKAPKLYRWMPRFALNYLKRIVHEEECNAHCSKHTEDTPAEFCAGGIELFSPIIKTLHLDRWPKEGRCLVAANHPLGGLDGIILMHLMSQIRTDIQFPANDLLQVFKPLNPYFIPINKHGSNKENMVKFNKAFEEDNAMLYFPAGMVSRKNDEGKIMDLEWKTTFVKKCIETKRDIYPTYIDAQNSNFFYNLSRWRTKLGIKANIEMLYLSDEMFKQRGKTTTVIAGKPIKWELLDKSRSAQEWTDAIKAHVYKLKDNPDAEFDYSK